MAAAWLAAPPAQVASTFSGATMRWSSISTITYASAHFLRRCHGSLTDVSRKEAATVLDLTITGLLLSHTSSHPRATSLYGQFHRSVRRPTDL
ncbi:uncharacterized protein M421DRAFT_421463 [Didymella exigua CBS 183.55]|uniref:Uncharacterized protein n=1 Tax=Didymella exigua CBS 183.55 TaxID=1150837 RepID=A0A6A5RQ48_9PLEO|nr:uncharacterized protein M421DRAFT_421463 [Didymella exigua CBS 183.55]KAF1927617.1 hypothetical protein M421DRAFT_421463 [Didymella exigua CBS 183.55]